MEFERYIKPLASTAFLASLTYAVSTLAFSSKSHREVLQRAGYRSEWSGIRNMPLEASHMDHTKDSEYDNPDRGEAITILEHLAYHEYYRGNADYIGLTEKGNEWAVDKIKIRLRSFYRASGIVVANLETYINGQVRETIEDYKDLIDPEP